MKLEPCPECGYPLSPIYEPNTLRVMAECHRCKKSILYSEWMKMKLERYRREQESYGQNFWECMKLKLERYRRAPASERQNFWNRVIVATILVCALLKAFGF